MLCGATMWLRPPDGSDGADATWCDAQFRLLYPVVQLKMDLPAEAVFPPQGPFKDKLQQKTNRMSASCPPTHINVDSEQNYGALCLFTPYL